MRVELREGGERAVVADAGGGGDAVGDFALHHEHGAVEEIGARGGVEVEQDVGGDVVGEIADDVERGCLVDRVEARSNCEDVGVVDGDARVVAELEGELSGEGWVELYAVKMCGACGEDGGDGAVAGADLDDGASGDVAEARRRCGGRRTRR